MQNHFSRLFLMFAAVIIFTMAVVYVLRDLAGGYVVAAGAGMILAGGLAFLQSKNIRDEFHQELAVVKNVLQGNSPLTEINRDRLELETILSNMVEGVIVVERNEKIKIASGPISGMLDLRTKELTGRPYWETIRNEQVNAAIKEALEKKDVVKIHLSTLLPKEQYFSMRVSPVLNQKGELSSVTAVFHDITEIKRLEKVRTEFIANVSHELKTPLTSIKGFIETLESGAIRDPKKAEKFLQIIHKHAEQLTNLVEDILRLSAIESREFKLNLTKADLRVVIENVIALYREEIERKKQRWRLKDSKVLEVQADARKLEQVFANLIANAIKYTPEGGEITIALQDAEGSVRVDVTDTGIGIPKEHLARVFERFYRVEKERSRDQGGTGLGLAIAKHIVSVHGGRIEVQSEVGAGSTFSVFLPKTPPDTTPSGY